MTKDEEIKQVLKERADEVSARTQEALAAIGEGKGVLRLETPILAGDEEKTELLYDFTDITGLEYADAMDFDNSAVNVYKITSRQALALFAKAAAKQTDGLDFRDIIERIGITDALEGIQLANLFFNASTRAGRLRITKKS